MSRCGSECQYPAWPTASISPASPNVSSGGHTRSKAATETKGDRGNDHPGGDHFHHAGTAAQRVVEEERDALPAVERAPPAAACTLNQASPYRRPASATQARKSGPATSEATVAAAAHHSSRRVTGPLAATTARPRNPRTNVLGHCTGRTRERRPRQASRVAVRRGEGLPGLRRERRRRRDQLLLGVAGSARRADRAGPRPRLPLRDRLGRARARSAPHGARRLRARRTAPHLAERIVTTWPVEDVLSWAKG